jgi:hypothetical protein
MTETLMTDTPTRYMGAAGRLSRATDIVKPLLAKTKLDPAAVRRDRLSTRLSIENADSRAAFAQAT